MALAAIRRCVHVIRSDRNVPLIACWLVVALAETGCSSPTPTMPWSDTGNTYTLAEMDLANGTTGVVIGRLANPIGVPPGWENIGEVMSDALKARLADRHDLSVRRNDALGADVEFALAASTERRRDLLRGIQQRDRTVRYVIIGRVTDLRYPADAPSAAAANSVPRQHGVAITAITTDIVDLHQRRVVATERHEARAWAGDTVSSATYSGVAPGSHRFWDSPIGLAARDAVNQSAEAFNRISPPAVSTPIRIVDRLTERRIRLAGESATRAAIGSEWYVCRFAADGTTLEPLNDPATRQPLKARIETRSEFPTAWLLGEPPAGTRLNQAVLCRILPNTAHAAAN